MPSGSKDMNWLTFKIRGRSLEVGRYVDDNLSNCKIYFPKYYDIFRPIGMWTSCVCGCGGGGGGS